MLDLEMIAQLKNVFSKLENNVNLVLSFSAHEKFEELREMLISVASTSNFINLVESKSETKFPEFFIEYKGKNTGISFLGIPGGHEFPSLILAILNVDGKGKLPYEALISRIKNIKGPVNLRTYVSLTCENCPEVIQALNIISIYNENFTHQMINGELVQEEINRLNIQGVPSVFSFDDLVATGRNTISDLISKLEEKFGTQGDLKEKDLGLFDVVVIGGGPAGISAAIYTSRKGFKTAIVASKIGGQVQETKGIENMISIPYIEGSDLSQKLEFHAKQYPITILDHRLLKASIKTQKKFY